MIPELLTLAIVLPGFVSRRTEERLGAEYGELVNLRGATVTMLETHRIGVVEARRLRAMLDVARHAADAGLLSKAHTELEAIRAYLRARQGEPL